MNPTSLALMAAASAAASTNSWHRKAVGVPLDSAFIPHTNETVLVSGEFVSRISKDGEILWRQIHKSQNPQIQAGKFVYVLEEDLLSAFNVSNGAKEWTYQGVDSFAADGTLGVVVESLGKYGTLKPTFTAGHHAVSNPQWTSIPTGYDHEIYACQEPLLKSKNEFYHLNGTKTQCNQRKPDLDIQAGTVSLKDKWSLHEGLSNSEAACILSRLQIAEDHQGESWKVRTARHSALKWLSPSSEERLLVVGTKDGSLYGLDAERSGDIKWVRHGAYPPGAKISGEKDLVVVESKYEKSVYTFEGNYILTQPTAASLHAYHGYRYETLHNTLHGYNNSQETWRYTPENMTIRSISHRGNIPTSSIAKRVGPNDYLYRYLNPNLLAVVNENTTNFELVLLDAISGRHLGSAMHSKVGTVSTPLERPAPEVAIGANWVAYSDGAKVRVLELFETSSLNTRLSHSTQSSLNDTLVPYSVEYTHDLMQAKKLAAVTTGQGTGSGLLVYADKSVALIPQWRLLSRLQHAAQESALESLSEYAPVHGMITHVAASATRFESTAAIAVLGSDIFFSLVEPSGTFDKLPLRFSYSGVIFSLFILVYLAYQLSLSHMHATSQLVWS